MKSFKDILDSIKPYTLLDENRLMVLYTLSHSTASTPGDAVEVGVYRGGSSYLMAATAPSRPLYACDTYEGLPAADATVDMHKQGDFNTTSVKEVAQLLSPLDNAQVRKGLFPQDPVYSDLHNKQFSFIHIDVDLYEQTLNCLKFFYPRMPRGAILVSDDYNWWYCPGVKKAFDEFFADKPEVVIDTGFKSCYFVKS